MIVFFCQVSHYLNGFIKFSLEAKIKIKKANNDAVVVKEAKEKAKEEAKVAKEVIDKVKREAKVAKMAKKKKRPSRQKPITRL